MKFKHAPIKTVENWAKEIDASMLLVMAIDAGGSVCSISWGKTKPLCDKAGKMLDEFHDFTMRDGE